MSVMNLDPILTRRAEIQRVAARSLRRRELSSRVTLIVCVACIAVALVPLVAIVAYTAERGIAAWSVVFFTHLPTPAGIPGGGIVNSIVGSLIIDAVAIAGALPIGLATGIFLAESESRIAAGIRFAADVLSGVPSITVAIFAYGILVLTLHHFSGIAASFVIGFIMLPVMIRASETAIRTVPKELPEAALSLGARKAGISWRVVLPTALPGLVTGMLLAIVRGAGESAPLLFTAIGSQYMSVSPFGPMAAMPLTIYQDGIQAYPDLQRTAWGTGLALLLFILVISVSSRVLSSRMGRKRR